MNPPPYKTLSEMNDRLLTVLQMNVLSGDYSAQIAFFEGGTLQGIAGEPPKLFFYLRDPLDQLLSRQVADSAKCEDFGIIGLLSESNFDDTMEGEDDHALMFALSGNRAGDRILTLKSVHKSPFAGRWEFDVNLLPCNSEGLFMVDEERGIHYDATVDPWFPSYGTLQ